MRKLSRHNREKLVELLSERLSFERAAVRLYETILAKLDRSAPLASRESERGVDLFRDEMLRFRDEEMEHEDWLVRVIRSLGGDISTGNALGGWVERESKGIEEVVHEDNLLPHVMHALFAAELVDAAGWGLLVDLADDADDVEARIEFEKRFIEEERHLSFARMAMRTFARKSVLGYERTISPASTAR